MDRSSAHDAARHILTIIPLVMRTVAAELRAGGDMPAPAHFGLLAALGHQSRTLTELEQMQGVSLPTMSNSISRLGHAVVASRGPACDAGGSDRAREKHDGPRHEGGRGASCRATRRPRRVIDTAPARRPERTRTRVRNAAWQWQRPQDTNPTDTSIEPGRPALRLTIDTPCVPNRSFGCPTLSLAGA